MDNFQTNDKRKNKRKAKKHYREELARATPGIVNESIRIRHLLENDEANQYAWQAMQLNPWGPVSRLPLILGNGVYEERIYRYKLSGTMVANGALKTFALLCADSWNQAASTDHFMGTSTVGNPGWYTNASYAASTSPAVGATTATAGLLALPLASDVTYGGANPKASTHVLNTACAVRVKPISTSDTTGGEIMVAFTRDPYEYPLTGVDFGTVFGYPDDVVVKHRVSCANWSPDTWLEIPAIPVERRAFEAQLPDASGTTSVERPMLGVFATGLATGESFDVECCLIYQVETDGSNEVHGLHIVPSHATSYRDRPHPANQHLAGGRPVTTQDRAQLSSYSASMNVTPGIRHENTFSTERHPVKVLRSAAKALLKANPGLGSRIANTLARFAGSKIDDPWVKALKYAIPAVTEIL